MAMTHIALIGLGAIGTATLELLQGQSGLQVSAIVVPADITRELRERARHLAPQAELVHNVPAEGIDLVVEAAGHSAIEQHVLPALARGVACIVASVGATSAPDLFARLEDAAMQGGTSVELIAGAIGAIDALAAARIGGLSTVRYTGRKPPKAWRGTPAQQVCKLDELTAPHVIFEGTARQAATLYPQNANVAATVSLAGLGLDATQVRLIADPTVDENIHQVEAAGSFGRLNLQMCNQPLVSNPKTSALTVYSLVRAIRNRTGHVLI